MLNKLAPRVGRQLNKEPPKKQMAGTAIKASDLVKVRASQKQAAILADKRIKSDKITLNSYLGVCVHVGHTNQAFNLLLKHARPKLKSIPDVQHYNIVIKGWAEMGQLSQVIEARVHMIKNNIQPNSETFAYLLLAYSKTSANQRKNVKKFINEMRSKNIDPAKLFHSAYLNPDQRESVKNLLKNFDPMYEDIFCDEPIGYDCKLMNKLSEIEPISNDLLGLADLSKLESWADHQRSVESKSSIAIKSVARVDDTLASIERYRKLWRAFNDIWSKALTKALDESLESLKEQFTSADKIHLYPYLCSVDKNLLVRMMLDEVETNAVYSSYSMSTNNLHSNFGNRVMIRYLRAKSLADGSHSEKQKIYNSYLDEYCKNPELMGMLNSREYVQKKAFKMKNYAVYKEKYTPVEPWPAHIIAAVGRFLYGIILREVKFDPEAIRNPNRDINPKTMVHGFYTAYFQIDSSHKIKEEFRAHQEFEKLHKKACYVKLKFDYSFLPTSSPPMPWLSPEFGGYLTNKSDLVRVSTPFGDQFLSNALTRNNQKLYPSLDSLNVLGFCPWIVNKEILDLVIELFRAGGDAELNVPLDESKMKDKAPVLKDGDNKANRILYNKEKKKYDQKKREMYSLWRDCLYRLSIANHFRDRVFWFPHNMDFRGRTYPIPPHFNHLGSDLARSLLLFAKGQPLGDKGLDWLKIHLINLVGNKKSCSLSERLDYANSILHMEVLDSADNPWDGRRWWTKNDDPWQVLACCKEIAKAIRSEDFRNYISHFPVHQDGSCNGLQHYAALGRDPGGALAVNLIPCDKPQDVYSRVVEIVEEMRKQDAEKGVQVAIPLDGFIQRKVIKQTVMTTVYGVTRYGARQQIAKQLAAKGYPEKEIWMTAQYLASKTFQSIGKMFNKSRFIQDWLTLCAHIIASRFKQPVGWNTPLGFPVTQPYKHLNLTSTNRLLSPSIWSDKPQYYDPLAQLNTSKQRSAFPPNYIHSLDSSHMMLTSLYCQRQGITFVSVHDCFWTHPNTVDAMNRICRQQFVAMHSEPLLQNLSDEFIQKFEKYEIASDESSKFVKSSRKDKASKQAKKSSTKSDGVNESSKSGYDDKFVEEDLNLLLNEEVDGASAREEGAGSLTNIPERLVECLHHPQEPHHLKPLLNVHESERMAAINRIHSILREVPETGDLDLDVILKSTYFFS